MAVSDLTGTTWKFKNSGLVVTAETQGSGINNIQGTVIDINNNTNTFTELTLYPSSWGDTNFVQLRNYDSTTQNAIRPTFRYTDTFGQWKVILDGSDDWVNTSDVIVTFTGGNTTSSALIAFMEANATQVVPTGKTQLGTRAITKKMFGTREITKEVVNGVVVYEKQAPTPSGFSVTIECSGVDDVGDCFYSLDDGATWVDMSSFPSGIINLTDVTQIKFKADDPGVARWGKIKSSQLGLNLSGEDGPNLSQNYILTQNITDVRAYTYFDYTYSD